MGLLQQKNSNFEGSRVSMPPQSGFLPVKQIDGEKYIAQESEDTLATNRVPGCLPQNFLCS